MQFTINQSFDIKHNQTFRMMLEKQVGLSLKTLPCIFFSFNWIELQRMVLYCISMFCEDTYYYCIEFYILSLNAFITFFSIMVFFHCISFSPDTYSMSLWLVCPPGLASALSSSYPSYTNQNVSKQAFRRTIGSQWTNRVGIYKGIDTIISQID